MAENVSDVAISCIRRAKNVTQTQNEFRRTCFVHLDVC